MKLEAAEWRIMSLSGLTTGGSQGWGRAQISSDGPKGEWRVVSGESKTAAV